MNPRRHRAVLAEHVPMDHASVGDHQGGLEHQAVVVGIDAKAGEWKVGGGEHHEHDRSPGEMPIRGSGNHPPEGRQDLSASRHLSLRTHLNLVHNSVTVVQPTTTRPWSMRLRGSGPSSVATTMSSRRAPQVPGT